MLIAIQSNRLSSSPSESNPVKVSSTSGGMSSISEQKATGEASYRHDLEEVGGVPGAGSDAGAGFAYHKPGGSDTLPGWETAKGAFKR